MADTLRKHAGPVDTRCLCGEIGYCLQRRCAQTVDLCAFLEINDRCGPKCCRCVHERGLEVVVVDFTRSNACSIPAPRHGDPYAGDTTEPCCRYFERLVSLTEKRIDRYTRMQGPERWDLT